MALCIMAKHLHFGLAVQWTSNSRICVICLNATLQTQTLCHAFSACLSPLLIPASLYLFEKESCQICVKTKHDYILKTLFKNYDAWG